MSGGARGPSTLFLAARTPASWGLYRGRIQPRGSELDRELSRACCGGEGCIPESLTHGGQGLSGRLELSVNPRKEDPAKLLGQFVVHGPQSALPTADLGGNLAHLWSPGVSILSPVYRHSVALGQDWVYLVIPVSQYLAQSRSPEMLVHERHVPETSLTVTQGGVCVWWEVAGGDVGVFVPPQTGSCLLAPGPGWALMGNGEGPGVSGIQQPELIFGVEAGDFLMSGPL